MQLNVNRVLSDRLVFDPDAPGKLRVSDSFWDWIQRIISWIWSPASYSDENRRTIACFKKCVLDTLGADRLKRICSRYSLDFEAMEKKGSPLLSRDVAQIVVGAKNVTVEDINGFIKRGCFQDLDSAALAGIVQDLSRPFGRLFEVPDIEKRITGRPSERLSRVFYDPFLADRERAQLTKEHRVDPFEVFMHNMVARVIKREMDVGTLVPAPNHPSGKPQFYYVSAKVVTGEGMVSYLFHPATRDTNLEPIRLFRGTSARNSEIDGVSTVITDLETDLGRAAYESGLIYEPIIAEKMARPTIEAGHSLGSTLVQYRAANMDHIRKAYLFCGPGLPESEVEKFNAKNPNIELIIHLAHHDRWSSLGQVQLGYKAPPNVQISYLRAIGKGPNPHVDIWVKEDGKYVLKTGHTAEERDGHFFNKGSTQERLRSSAGPVVSCLLRTVRNVYRKCFSNRAETERGLKIGHMLNGRWQVDHFRTI